MWSSASSAHLKMIDHMLWAHHQSYLGVIKRENKRLNAQINRLMDDSPKISSSLFSFTFSLLNERVVDWKSLVLKELSDDNFQSTLSFKRKM